jgi:hypothetical protein
MTDWLTGADPSWFPRVLAVLQRDYPEIADKIWSTAIGENADRMVRYWAPLRGSEPCPRCGTPAGELHREDCGTALREQLTRQAEPDTSCPDCHVPVGAEHTLMCGVSRGSGQVIWPGYEDDEPGPWRCPECRTLLRYSHSDGCSMADPGPVAPSPWGHPEPEDPDRDRMDDAELASHQAHEPAPLDGP